MAKTKQSTAQATAYSYFRFSNPEQSKGDSLRRQTEKRDAWLLKTGAVLDTTVSLEDRGVSGFTGEHRKNADRHALAAFLELVKKGRIARGSYLIVESLDRLSREHIRPALTLLLNLIEAGIRVVQLLPIEVIYDESVEPMSLMMAIMELSRGNSESQMKSERVGSAWQEKKRRAAIDKEPLTRRTPAWLRVVNGKCEVIEDAAETVKQIYQWAIDGFGIGVITKHLNDGVPPVGTTEFWGRSSVAKILTNRAVVGEYQPHTGRGRKRRADGNPIPNYYPVIISEQQWFAARAAMSSRRNKAGRLSKSSINLFASLVHDARDGSPMHQVDKGSKEAGGKLLVSYRASQGIGRYVSFPLQTFERAVLSCLREIDPREILPTKDPSGEKVLALSGRVEEVEGRIERIKAKLLESDDIDSLTDVLRQLDGKRKALAEQLAEARQEAASPVLKAWEQCQSLIDALDNAPDPAEMRVRLRAAIRRIIDSVWMMVIPRGRNRLAAVQLWFADGKTCRNYVILHKPALGGTAGSRPAAWSVRSLVDVVQPGDLDLRKSDHAARLEKALSAVKISDLASK